MICKYCGATIADSETLCPNCGNAQIEARTSSNIDEFWNNTRERNKVVYQQEHRKTSHEQSKRLIKKVVLVTAIVMVVTIALISVLSGNIHRLTKQNSVEPDGAIVNPSQPLPTSSTHLPTPTPTKSTPTETPLPTDGYSVSGSELSDIIYDSNGNILSLTENNGKAIYKWLYVYDDNNEFLYRKRNIGNVSSHLTSSVMPGTDVTYSELDARVENCVGFTIQYEVTTVRKGDGLGDRYLYVYTGLSWEMIGTFSYGQYGKTSADIKIDSPTDIERFTTPRIHADDSSFMIEQQLSDLWVADYLYVKPVSEN